MLAATETAPLPHHGAQWHPVRHLMRGAWLSALRRNEIYVVLILLALYLAGSVVLRIVGIQSAQIARFVTGLGLELGSLLSSLLVIAMGARQIPIELEQRTIYPVLAKPVTRWQVLLGKGLPTWGLGIAAQMLFVIVTLAVTPHLPYQHFGVFAQAAACKIVGLAMLTALVILLSVLLPSSMTMLLGGGMILFGSMAINALAGWRGAGPALAGLLPDFKLLEQFSRYVDGGEALGAGLFIRLMAYGCLWTALLMGLANLRFRRQPL